MKFRQSIFAGAALALALAQAGHAASPASKLSLSQSPALANQVKRADAPVARTSQLTNRTAAALLFGTIAAGLLVWLVTLDNKPDSP
jgi:hypothetical protein